MRTLLLSGILYLIGIIIVLFLRPALMFNEKGEWKEFGLISSEHTVFPFWMFCLVWAVLSYIICLIVIGEFNNKAVAVVAGMGSSVAPSLYESELPEDLVPVLPTKTKSKKKETSTAVKGDMKPGYYKLDTKELDRTGVPKYLYVGEDMPGPVEVEE